MCDDGYNLSKKELSEFEKSLKEKYGPKWMLAKLTDEEYDKLEVDVEAIKEALKKGMEEARKAWLNRPAKKRFGNKV